MKKLIAFLLMIASVGISARQVCYPANNPARPAATYSYINKGGFRCFVTLSAERKKRIINELKKYPANTRIVRTTEGTVCTPAGLNNDPLVKDVVVNLGDKKTVGDVINVLK